MSEVRARKDHMCSLCHQFIPKGERYERQTITPWDHDNNETFFEFKAHLDCYKEWKSVGDSCEWVFPETRTEWLELVGPEGKKLGTRPDWESARKTEGICP